MPEFSKIVFFNYYGVGDLFNSRQFIKDIMNQFPNKEYFYDHGKPANLFEDVDIKKYHEHSPCIATTPTRLIDDTLFINTWIGRDSKYVLPGIGCKISQNRRMFNDLLNEYGIRLMHHNDYYIPKIEWGRLRHLDIVEKWLFADSEYRSFILICNGSVHSEQADNFDLTQIIYRLSSMYPDKYIVVTEPLPVMLSNIIPTHYIMQGIQGTDVNYISYLSLYADLVVGRSSGPFTCCMTNDFVNPVAPAKKAITFVRHPNAGYFVDDVGSVKSKLYISLAKEEDKIIKDIETALNE